MDLKEDQSVYKDIQVRNISKISKDIRDKLVRTEKYYEDIQVRNFFKYPHIFWIKNVLHRKPGF